MMLIASSGIRLVRSTNRPTGIVKTAPISSETELSRPILVSPMWSACSSCGATAPTVAVSAPLRASTDANITITLARAAPPTRLTTSPRSARAAQRMTCSSSRPIRAAKLPESRIDSLTVVEPPFTDRCSQPQIAHDPRDRRQPERDRAIGEHAYDRPPGGHPERRERTDHPSLDAADPTRQRKQAAQRADEVAHHQHCDRQALPESAERKPQDG